MILKVICLSLFTVLFAGSSFAGVGAGSITGKWITKQYGPMAGAQVLLFNAAAGPPPAGSKFLRIPDAGTPIDSKGKFSAVVPAGKYYLVMRKRANPESAGPPQEGDPQYYARLKNGKPKAYEVKPGKITDIGTVKEFVPYKKEKIVARDGMTGIEGTVSDEQGQPVAGVRVLVYDSSGMVGRPLYASDETGADGKYFLTVSHQGTYYLKVRTHYGGGRPVNGELMGSYGKSGEPGVVNVENGKIVKGINIEVSKFSAKGNPE